MIERLKKNNMLKVFPEEQEIMDARSNMLNLLESRRQSINPLGDMLVNMGASMMSGDRNEMPLQSLGRGLKEGNAAFHASRQAQDSYLGKQMEIHDAVSNSIKAVREYDQKKQFQDRSLDLQERKLSQTKELELAKMRHDKNKSFYEEEARNAAKDMTKAETIRRFLPQVQEALEIAKKNPGVLDWHKKIYAGVTGEGSKEVADVQNAIKIVNELYRIDTGDKGGKPPIPDDASPTQKLRMLAEYAQNMDKLIDKSDAMQTLVKRGLSISDANQWINSVYQYNDANPTDAKKLMEVLKEKKKLAHEEPTYGTDLQKQALDRRKELLFNSVPTPQNESPFVYNDKEALMKEFEANKALPGGGWSFDRDDVIQTFKQDGSVAKFGDPKVTHAVVDAMRTMALPADVLQFGINKIRGTESEKRISHALEDTLYSIPVIKENRPKNKAEEVFASIATLPIPMSIFGKVGSGLANVGEKLNKTSKFLGKPLELPGKFLKAGSNPLYPVDLAMNAGTELGSSASDNPLVSIPLGIAGGFLGSGAGTKLLNKAAELSFTKKQLADASKESVLQIMENYGITSLPADSLNQIFKFVEGMSIASVFGLGGNKIIKNRALQKKQIEELLIDGGVSKEVAGAATREIVKDVRKGYVIPKSNEWNEMNSEIDKVVKDVPLNNTLEYFQEHLGKLEGNKDAVRELLTTPMGRFITALFGKSAKYEKGKFTTVVIDNEKMLVPTELVDKLSSKNGLIEVLNEINTMPREHVKRVLNKFEKKYKNELKLQSKDSDTFELSKGLNKGRADLYAAEEGAILQKFGQPHVDYYRELRNEHYHYKKFEESEVNKVFKNEETKGDSEFFTFFVDNASKNGKFTQRIMDSMEPKDVAPFRSSFNKQLGFDPHVAAGESNFNAVKFAKNYNKLSDEAKRTIYGDEKVIYDDLVRVVHNVQSAVGGYNMSNTYNVASILKQALAFGTLTAAGYYNFTEGSEFKSDAKSAATAILLNFLGYNFAANPRIAKKLIGLSKTNTKKEFVKDYSEMMGLVKDVPSRVINVIKNQIFRNLPENFTPVYDEKGQRQRED